MPSDLAEEDRVLLDRFRDALEQIDRRIEHHGCHGCAVCIAHNALHGHWPAKRCCWSPAACQMAEQIESRR
jgi:hypothetical protein